MGDVKINFGTIAAILVAEASCLLWNEVFHGSPYYNRNIILAVITDFVIIYIYKEDLRTVGDARDQGIVLPASKVFWEAMVRVFPAYTLLTLPYTAHALGVFYAILDLAHVLFHLSVLFATYMMTDRYTFTVNVGRREPKPVNPQRK